MGQKNKRRRVLAVSCVLVALIFGSVSSLADQLPPRKVFVSLTPATAGDINYNFTLLWNHLNGGHLAADNFPGACMKTGCDFSGGVKHVSSGLTLTNSSASTTAAGRLKILNAAAMLQLSSAAGGVASLVLESVEGALTWTIQKNSADMLIIDGPNDFTHYIQINDPITFSTYGITKFTESVDMKYTSPMAPAAVTDPAIWRMPNQGFRASDLGEYKVRAHIICGAGGGAVTVDIAWQFMSDGEPLAGIPVLATPAAVACGALGTARTTAWVTIGAGAADPVAIDKFLWLMAVNNGASGAAILDIGLEVQYKAQQLGKYADN